MSGRKPGADDDGRAAVEAHFAGSPLVVWLPLGQGGRPVRVVISDPEDIRSMMPEKPKTAG